MPEHFFELSPQDQSDALDAAAQKGGSQPHLLEKDIWVVWALDALFSAKLGQDLVFKGGTSLSKGYGAIERFSEDIDLTYSIRAIAPDLVENSLDALPSSKSQAQKWTREIRGRLSDWARNVVLPLLSTRLAEANLNAKLRANKETIEIEYEPLRQGSGYVRPMVLLEFGARSTGAPCEPRSVECDAARWMKAVAFPTATPRTMRPERTFWEKATAIHVFCLRSSFRGGPRFSRHWYDLDSLYRTDYGLVALADRELAAQVARHKNCFFREKDLSGNWIDYGPAVNGGLRLVPDGTARKELNKDYDDMQSDGLLSQSAPDFNALLDSCRELQDQANQRSRGLV